MANVKYGGGVVEMSGSIAGNVFARNRSGFYVRARTHPINPNTSNQQAVRGILTYLSARWSGTLTAAQRTAWNLYASSVAMKNKLGEVIYLSGYNHYLRSDCPRLQAGLPVVDAGPTIFELPEKDPTIVDTISEAAQQHSLAFDDALEWIDEDDAALLVLEGSPQNAQRNFFAGPYKYVSFIEGDSVTPPTTPDTFATEHVVVEGQRIWIQCRISRADGRLSEPFRADTFCTS